MTSLNNLIKNLSGGYFVIIAVLWLSVIIFLLGPAHGSTIIVGDNQSIQSKIDGAIPGDVLLLMSKSYNESIVIDKPITIRGTGMSTIDSQGNDSAILLAADGVTLENLTIVNASSQGLNIVSNNNTIKNNTIESCVTGMNIFNSSNNTIEDNILINNGYGILLDSAKKNRILSNNASYNQGHGIYFLNSDENICNDSKASYNVGDGFYIESSSHNSFNGCIAMENGEKGFELYESHDNSGTGIIALKNNIGISIYQSRDDLINGCLAENNTDHGLQIFDSTNSSFVTNNLINNTLCGIDLTQISECLIKGNNASNNGDHGIFAMDSANSTITDNQANGNREIGICLSKAGSSTIANNSAERNIIGIALFNSKNNSISKNRIELNGKGLSFESGSNYNTVINNIMERNGAGIMLMDSNRNRIENNSINNSGVSAFQRSSFNIILNNSISYSKIGLYLNRSDNNSIKGNDFDHNGVGFAINMSAHNIIENRTFLNNNYDLIINGNGTLSSNIFVKEIIPEEINPSENRTLANGDYYDVINENKTLSSNTLWEDIMPENQSKDFLKPYERGAERYIETPEDTGSGHVSPVSGGKTGESGKSGVSMFISIESICEEYFNSLAEGKMLFNAPENMSKSETYTVEAYIPRNYTLNLSSNPSLTGVDRWFNLDKVGEYMGLKLEGGSAFLIDPAEEREEYIPKGKFGTWTWKVTPLLTGTQKLTLIATTYYKYSLNEKGISYSSSFHRDVEVIPKEIEIQVGEPAPKKDILTDITSRIGEIVALLIAILTLIKLGGEVIKRKKE